MGRAGGVLRGGRRQFGRQLPGLRVECGDPLLLLGQGLEPRCLSAERFVDFQPLDLGHQLLPSLGDPPEPPPTRFATVFQFGEFRQTVVGQLGHRFERLPPAINFLPLVPTRLDLGGGGQHAQSLVQFGFFRFECLGTAIQIVVLFLCRQIVGRGPAQVMNLGPQPVLLLSQLDQTTRTIAIGQKPLARRLQVTDHVGERDPIGAERQFVQQVRRGAVAESGQFLDFAQAERKHVVEDRFVDAFEQPGQTAGVTLLAPLIDDVERLIARLRVEIAVDDQRLMGVVDRERSTRRAAVLRRDVALAACWRETIQDGPDELHHGGFACFVLAVKDDKRCR